MEPKPAYEGYRLQPRINLRRDLSVRSVNKPPVVRPATLVHRLFGRASDDDCQVTESSNTCEKPVGRSMTLPIIFAIVVPIVIIAAVLFYLHRRKQKQEALEDLQDQHKSLDFGLGEQKKSARRSLFMGGGGEKGLHHKPSQLSMDMNLSSPYLLPPGLQQSHESLHSLARSIGTDHQDPYIQAAAFSHGETGSIRSFNGNKEAGSIYTKSSGGSAGLGHMPRTNSLPRSPLSPSGTKEQAFGFPAVPEPAHKPSPTEVERGNHHVASIIPEIGVVSDFDNHHEGSAIQQPPAARSKSPQFELPAFVHSSDNSRSVGDDFPLPPQREHEHTGLGLNFHLPNPSRPVSSVDDVPQSAPLPSQDGQNQYSNYQSGLQPTDYDDGYGNEARGRNMQRQSFLEDQQQQGLGVPQQENKRLSVGFRPLPPDEITESEDPEYRANRIRSFYKEYFDPDTKEAPPVPPMPQASYGAQGPPAPRAAPQYYEDYDQGYAGEPAAYFDPDSNAFVMPYAEPVTRRAMTPPPAGRRGGPGGPGLRGPRFPHGPNGSIGGMSYQGGPRGRPRAGSALGPRPDSSASARVRQQPRRPMPPPADLTTLPTPSKLKDDSFALNVLDFAPPERIRDTAAGRSQSPLGERRPYSPQVPVANTLVTAFDELAALPSPHVLRKSGTFTGLDFAPPKKFKDSDTMSDAGSIRSNRSGISAAQLGAIRGGAGRVSRLPGDTVFESASLQNTLKPSWNIRP